MTEDSVDPKAIFQKIKEATIPIAIFKPHDSKHPYEVIGSGFCIHPRGVVVSCSHVISAFFERPIDTLVSAARSKNSINGSVPLEDFRMVIPHAMFCCRSDASRFLTFAPVPFEVGINMLDCDLTVGRISNHAAFPNGYPTVDLANYAELYEGMEIGTCGFPLGNRLADQFGTLTSSFTRGILSSVIPANTAERRNVSGFQLNITATHGNSGGPVFMWQTGSVFGVLQSGPRDHNKQILPGFAKAVPIWKVLENDALETILSLKSPHPETRG